MTNKIEDLQTEYMSCECMSPEHTLRFTFILDEDPRHSQVITEVYLNNYRRWYQRLWVAIKYVFGYQSKYGAWDNCIMKRPDVVKLRGLLEEFERITPDK